MEITRNAAVKVSNTRTVTAAQPFVTAAVVLLAALSLLTLILIVNTMLFGIATSVDARTAF
jgi:hypothetical protein